MCSVFIGRSSSRTVARLLLCWLPWTLPLAAQVSVSTYQYDNTRVGSNLSERLLTPRNVTPEGFGKLFQQSVDGSVYAQPLYLPNVRIEGKGRHNVVFVATEHDSVYAFDADDNHGGNAEPLWHASFIDPDKGIVAVPAQDYIRCPAIVPEIGITGTPVIDPAAGTLYVEAMTKESVGDAVSYVHRLHALDVTTGKERPGSPVKIEATVPGTGDDADKVVFTPRNQKLRTGLLLLKGVVYTAWTSQCERLEPFHGWLLGYDARTLRQVDVFNSSPNGTESSFWESGVAPAADSKGDIFVVTGNGTFNYGTGGADLGQSYIELSTRKGLKVKDYFTPFNVAHLNRHDTDLGSSGAILLPDGVGNRSHPHLITGAGKEGRIYLLDRDHLGGHNANSDSQIVQSVEGAIATFFGKPTYFNRSIYFCAELDHLKQFSIAGGKIEAHPRSQTAATFDYPGCVPTVSADGNSNGIVWLLESTGVLRAYDALDLNKELYDSNQNPTRDALGTYVKFTVPIVANGKVYAGTDDSLAVYGMLPQNGHSAAETRQQK